MPGIVVGHDGSKFAQLALEEAAGLAVVLGEPLLVVQAFRLRASDWPDDLRFGQVPTGDELEAHTRKTLEKRLEPIRDKHPDLAIELKVVEGKPARALIDASDGARLLVVANRGLGAFDRFLLGSVSAQVVQHARCDVLVNRAG
ncbi:universal stress protein [Mariniluteicoccus flavus]